MADGVRHELKAETLSQGRHLRYRNHISAAAAQHHHVRVVDHDPLRDAAQVAQRLGQKHLAIEALKTWIALEKQHPRITQNRRGGLHLALLSGQLELVRRRVMLELLSGLEGVLAYRFSHGLPDPVPTA